MCVYFFTPTPQKGNEAHTRDGICVHVNITELCLLDMVMSSPEVVRFLVERPLECSDDGGGDGDGAGVDAGAGLGTRAAVVARLRAQLRERDEAIAERDARIA